jgi:hypothetical protein
VGGGREDGAIVVLQNVEPVGNMGRVVFARVPVQFEIGTEKAEPTSATSSSRL